jgi:flagellin-like hook-associated protein FlgL
MAQSLHCTAASLAAIDAIIADMEQKIAPQIGHSQFELQMAFVKKLQVQLSQNSSINRDVDVASDLCSLRRLQVKQSKLAPATTLAAPTLRHMLSLFR